MCHGLGDHDLASVRPSDSSEEIFNNLELWALYRHEDLGLVVNGHTHRQEVRTFSHLTVIGVGTLHREQRPCCAIIDILGNRVEFYDLHNGSAIRNSEPVVWNGER